MLRDVMRKVVDDEASERGVISQRQFVGLNTIKCTVTVTPP
jgi:hypothetical protein